MKKEVAPTYEEFYNAVKTGDQIEINASEELAAVTMLKHND